jgi:hypothetical protein
MFRLRKENRNQSLLSLPAAASLSVSKSPVSMGGEAAYAPPQAAQAFAGSELGKFRIAQPRLVVAQQQVAAMQLAATADTRLSPRPEPGLGAALSRRTKRCVTADGRFVYPRAVSRQTVSVTDPAFWATEITTSGSFEPSSAYLIALSTRLAMPG